MRLVIAIGGNAIDPAGDGSVPVPGGGALAETCSQIAQIIDAGHEVVLVHGNGPQVGALMLQNEAARGRVPSCSLDVCDAQTQGQLGYQLQRLVGNALRARGNSSPVVALVTQVVVDPDDPGFREPSKPIGPFYPEGRARALMQDPGYCMKQVHPRRWRRVVPSPKPVRIVEMPAVENLLRAGVVPIAGGGGGIPVVEHGGDLVGVEAVVDKDYTAGLMASMLQAEVLLILTDVEAVYLDFETPQARRLTTLTSEAGWAYLKDGQFPAGSMGPKVEAALRFVDQGGRRAVIAPLPHVVAALASEVGTSVMT